ncbi:MAG TPA: hypothetical protein VGP45_02290, partial [Marinobacter sp.]|nr:hypothetical protein [Marinobacter sp.]
MSVFFIRVWVDGDSIVVVRTGEGLITDAGDYGNATFIDAVAEGAYVDAGTLRPTLTYANNVLSSSLVTLLPAKDVTALLAQSGYGGQAVYNWADGNQYQWNGNPWNATPLTSQAVATIVEDQGPTLFEEQGLFFIEDVESLPATGDFVGQKVFNRADGKLYEWNGTAWALVVAAVEAPDISGQLATNQIELDAITADLIANDAVQTENIANLAINADKIAANAITTAKIAADAVTAGELAANAVAAINIQTSAITSTKISDNAISSPKIAAGAITAGKISTGAVTAGTIAAGAVQAGDIAAGAVTAGTIAANAVTATEIAAGTITATEIATETITGPINFSDWAIRIKKPK